MTKPISTVSILYEVLESPADTGRWIVLRNGVPTGGFGPNLHLTANSAIAEARQDARASNLKIRVVSIKGKERTEEWESP